ncbi:EpsG family protein [Phocaeicola sp.]|uniref:EpsG family protein n=1 Tax=Phocaeicola sp. TaxID=2773926 RepID=UPI0023C68384|nr:EpsG family protein [Phocaeicola sp.]MDE5677366.1 EpsG family protein [Phocaeicola sp.]
MTHSLSLSTKRNGQYKALGILTFIVYPILSLPFILSGILQREKWAYLLGAVFMGYMGMLYPPAGDMYRYAEDFNLYKELDWDSFWIFMALKFDYFLPLLSWILGKCGAYPESTRFLFVTCSYYLLFDLYHDVTLSNKSMTKQIRVYSLVLLVPLIFSSFLFRMGLAQTVLVYGIYWYLIKGKRKGLFYIVFSAFIHVSYVPFVFIAVCSKYRLFNFSSKVFGCLCLLLVFVESSLLGVTLLRSLPFSDSLLSHLEEYITGSQSKDISSQFTIKQLIAKYFFNIVYYITLYQYYLFYKSNPQSLKIKRFVNIFIIIIIMSSSVPILHDRLLNVLKTFLILSSLYFMNNTAGMQRLLRIVVFFTIINMLFAFWQMRFFLKFSRIDVLFTSSSVQLMDFHYTDEWVSKNINEEGHLIGWLKLGYRPL